MTGGDYEAGGKKRSGPFPRPPFIALICIFLQGKVNSTTVYRFSDSSPEAAMIIALLPETAGKHFLSS